MHSGWPPKMAKIDPVMAVESSTSTGPICALPSTSVLRLSSAANVMAGPIEVKNMNREEESTLRWNPSVQSDR